MPRLTLWHRLLGRSEAANSGQSFDQAQKLILNNVGSEPLEVMIEVYPNRYVLQPGAKMVIEADLGGEPISISPYLNGLQIDAGNDIDPTVSINGVIVDSDWETPTPNSK